MEELSAWPAAELAARLAEAYRVIGVVVAHSLNDHRVVRPTPPAVLSPDESAGLLDAIERALTAVAARWPDPEEGSRHRQRSSA